ncbi:BnaC08g48090D [Brassica napus]|uniref:BnaC08g48090D protein n=1 Tax=Brassica napus TaxID=3708 RepID=A0A078ILW3_BRANA|nr:BnaC08g48090D [Brassica napus]
MNKELDDVADPSDAFLLEEMGELARKEKTLKEAEVLIENRDLPCSDSDLYGGGLRCLRYSACGLGSNGTDRLVQLVQGMQHNNSKSEDGTLYGAKITGGGSGYWP